MKLITIALLWLILIAAITAKGQSNIERSDEVMKYTRNSGPDIPNDPQWTRMGDADFMTKEEITRYAEKERDGSNQTDTGKANLEDDTPIAISPEGVIYKYNGKITEIGETEPLDDFFGYADMEDDTNLYYTDGVDEEDDEEQYYCYPFDLLPTGDSGVVGNGVEIHSDINTGPITTISSPFYQSTENISFTSQSLVVSRSGGNTTYSINTSVTFEFGMDVSAILITGLYPQSENINIGMGGYLLSGNFLEETFPLDSDLEIRSLETGSYLFISHGNSISYITLGHFIINGTFCIYDDIPTVYEDYSVVGNQTKSDRSVFSPDNRKLHKKTTIYPFRTLGAMHPPGVSRHYCSGAKIGPRHFLTAGHCIYDPDTKKWIPNAKIWFGQNGQTKYPPNKKQAPYGIKHHVWYYTTVGWLKGDWRYDYAMIILKDNRPTVNLGWFGYSSKPFRSDKGSYVYLRGFPGHNRKCSASPLSSNKCAGYLYGAGGRIVKQGSYHLFYKIDTNPGNSGSPVWDYVNGRRYVVGVHAYGDNGDKLNKAVRIRPAVFDNLKNWIAAWPSAYD